jgi:predicted RNase H-like HicB family nuclease
MKYEVIIYWSDADRAFIAEVPELAGCMADGPTKAKALVAVERVAKEWVETARALGRPIPEARGRLVFA